MTLTKRKGTDYLIYLSTSFYALGSEKAHDIDISCDSIDTSDKSNTGFKTYLPGLVDLTVNISGFFGIDDTNGWKALRAAILARTELTVTERNTSADHAQLSGKAYITNFKEDAPADGVVSSSVTLKASSAWTASTY